MLRELKRDVGLDHCESHRQIGDAPYDERMTPAPNKISARERARSATAARLAEEQARIKKNEDDLAQFFRADETIEKARAESAQKIERIREETEERVAQSDALRATSVLALKERGETVASIASMTGLTTTELNKLLKIARSAAPRTVSSAKSATPKSPEPAATPEDAHTPEPAVAS